MVRNSWALTWSLETITILICISETGSHHCSGKRNVWAEGALLSNVLLDVCGSRKDRHKRWEKRTKRQQEGELEQTIGVWPRQKLRVWMCTFNWLLGAKSAEQVSFALLNCICFCGCKQRWRILCETGCQSIPIGYYWFRWDFYIWGWGLTLNTVRMKANFLSAFGEVVLFSHYGMR